MFWHCFLLIPIVQIFIRKTKKVRNKNPSRVHETFLFCFVEGNTPLHEACFFGRDDAVKELLQAGASWKFVNKLGWTSLHVQRNDLKVFSERKVRFFFYL